MLNELPVQNLHRWLRVAGDVSNYILEDLGFVSCRCAKFDVQVLKFELFAAKVVAEPTEFASLILFAIFVRKSMFFEAFPNSG